MDETTFSKLVKDFVTPIKRHADTDTDSVKRIKTNELQDHQKTKDENTLGYTLQIKNGELISKISHDHNKSINFTTIKDDDKFSFILQINRELNEFDIDTIRLLTGISTIKYSN